MEPEGSLPHSQEPATCPYSESARSSPYPHTYHFLKFHLNIILPFKTGSPKWSLYLKFPHQNPIYASPLPIRATCPAHLIFLNLITRAVLGEYRSLSYSLCSFLNFPITSSLLGPTCLLSSLFSDTTGLISSLNVSDQVSHPYITTGKIMVQSDNTTVLKILLFLLLFAIIGWTLLSN